ncbi:caspase-1-A-like [Palaemon carinicauda]|uniref:caspase-1-A-like n=1 Tax=Palaemon carinicauda TaxID=392227 RepID=UPI0035B5A706
MAPQFNTSEELNVNGKRKSPELEVQSPNKKSKVEFNFERKTRRSPEPERCQSRKTTKIFDAVEKGDLETVMELIQDCGPAVRKAKCHSTLLHRAAANDHVALVRYLLRLIDPNVINKDGQTPVHVAAVNGHVASLKILLSDRNINPDKEDIEQKTYKDLLAAPLFKAVLWWNKKEIEELLKLGADPDYHAGGSVTGVLSRELQVTSARQLAQSLGRQTLVDMFPEERVPEIYHQTIKVENGHHSIFLPKTFGPLRLHVRPALNAISGPDVYERSTQTKGYVTILSYGSFQNRPDLVLEASQDDSNNVVDLFEKLGYKSDVYHNLTAEETKDTITNLRKQDVLSDVGCAVFYISSHSTGIGSFLTSDLKQLTTDWILNMFQESECPQLKNKPKIFIFDLCQGYYNQEEPSHQATHPVRVQEPLQDVLCIYSNTNGFSPYSFTREGSAFNTAFCRTLASHSSDKEIQDLYRELLREYRKNSPSAVPEMRNVGFTKKFYF